MKKYKFRIIERNGLFYPQYKKRFIGFRWITVSRDAFGFEEWLTDSRWLKSCENYDGAWFLLKEFYRAELRPKEPEIKVFNIPEYQFKP